MPWVRYWLRLSRYWLSCGRYWFLWGRYWLWRGRYWLWWGRGAHRTPCARRARRADAVRIVGRMSDAAATVGASHPIESLDRAQRATTYRALNPPQNGGGNRIGRTLPPPLGTHFSWLFWGRSRLARFLRGHQNIRLTLVH